MGTSVAEIAVLIGVPENTVKSYLHRARRLLHVMLKGRGFGMNEQEKIDQLLRQAMAAASPLCRHPSMRGSRGACGGEHSIRKAGW